MYVLKKDEVDVHDRNPSSSKSKEAWARTSSIMQNGLNPQINQIMRRNMTKASEHDLEK
jgi:hypothetical protein